MKLKIQADALRFRMTLSEAKNLQHRQQLSNVLALPGDTTLQFSIVIAEQLQVIYCDNHLILGISHNDLQQLMNNITPKGLSSYYESQGKKVDFSIQIDVPCHLDG